MEGKDKVKRPARCRLKAEINESSGSNFTERDASSRPNTYLQATRSHDAWTRDAIFTRLDQAENGKSTVRLRGSCMRDPSPKYRPSCGLGSANEGEREAKQVETLARRSGCTIIQYSRMQPTHWKPRHITEHDEGCQRERHERRGIWKPEIPLPLSLGL